MMKISQSDRTRGFQVHAFVFVATMVLLAAINLSKGEPYWVLWVLLGWGIGLLSHWWFSIGPAAVKSDAS